MFTKHRQWRSKQLQGAARPNLSNSITKDMILAYSGSQPSINIITGSAGTGTSIGTGLGERGTGTPFGYATRFDGINTGSIFTIPQKSLSSGITILCTLKPIDSPNSNPIVTLGDYASSGGGAIVNYTPGSSVLTFTVKDPVGSTSVVTSTSVLNFLWTIVVCRWSPDGSMSIFINGADATAGAPTGTVTSLSDITSVMVGGQGPTTLSRYSGRLPVAAGWARVLSDSEAKSVSLSPWQIVAPRRVITFSPSAPSAPPAPPNNFYIPNRNKRRKSQPTEAARIDWSNPVTQNLVLAHTGGSRVNYVSGKQATGVAVKGTSPFGRTLRASASPNNSVLTFAAEPKRQGTQAPYTMMALAPSTSSGSLVSLNNGASSGAEITAGAAYMWDTNQASDYFIFTSLNMVGSKYYNHACILSHGAIDARFFLDGVEDTAATLAPNGTVDVTPYTGFMVGNSYPGATNPLTGDVAFAAIWTRALSPAEIQSMALNPWQIFKARHQFNILVPLVQLIVPTSDIITGGWSKSTGSTLFGVLDETLPDSGDYIFSTTPYSYCEVGLGAAVDPNSSTGHILKYRLEPGTGTVTILLKQGGVIIAFWSHTLTGSVQNFSQTLTSQQADSITNYSNLRVTINIG